MSNCRQSQFWNIKGKSAFWSSSEETARIGEYIISASESLDLKRWSFASVPMSIRTRNELDHMRDVMSKNLTTLQKEDIGVWQVYEF